MSDVPSFRLAFAIPVIAISLTTVTRVALGGHVSREDPVEPIFTERPFIEKDIEADFGWERDSDGDAAGFALGTTWVVWERIQLGLDLPFGVSFPDSGSVQSGVDDVGISAKLLLCCKSHRGYTFFSIRGDLVVPSGDRSKGIGGEGSFSFSLLGGHGFTVVQSLPDLSAQFQLTYTQPLRLSAEQEALAKQFALRRIHEKEIDWNIAFAQRFFGGRFDAVFEVLGTTVIEALQNDVGTGVALAIGGWLTPFPDDHFLSNLSMGTGWQWPITNRRINDGAVVLIFEFAFD